MTKFGEATVLARAKELAAEDGFTWELNFGVPGAQGAPLRGQHFLSKEQQQQYLERARDELREGASNA